MAYCFSGGNASRPVSEDPGQTSKVKKKGGRGVLHLYDTSQKTHIGHYMYITYVYDTKKKIHCNQQV